MQRLFTTTAVALVFAVPFAAAANAATLRVTFVQTNDIDQFAGGETRGGFARLAAVVNAERAAGPTLFIHSGDTLSPSLLSGIDRGAHIIDILNRMGVDAMVPGNHEFDFGAEIFRARIAEATFDIVSSNLLEPDGSRPENTIEDKLVEIEGVTFGFYGLTTEDTPTVSSPGDITFEPSVDTGIEKAAELREAGADIVVAVVHTPREVDFELARTGAADVILSGHDEYLMTFYDGRAVITESGAQSERVVVTTLVIETNEDGSVVSWEPEFTIVDTATVEPDPAIQAVVDGYAASLDAELGVVIGTTETALDSRRASVRSQETAIGNLIADAMRAAVDADIAITNGGGIRADREYAAGTELTRGDILAELPFGNRTTKLELTGAQVIAALESGFSQVAEGAGRFPQVSGLSVEYDSDASVGERVLSVTVGGAPIDPEATYTVATNDFMAVGGDGYAAFTEGTVLIDPADAQIMASQVIDHVTAAGTIAPAIEGRIIAR
ncbi:MAG: 5'-nucleotidase C-terminal domain-containing protein [Bauldia sp.]|nr:5'-nucleotidase C-terminal domain-containing protein [Bauldia sp.]